MTASFQKILIVGLPGSGKSTFAVKLGARLGVKVHHLDTAMFTPEGVKRPKSEYLFLQETMLAKEKWIIEGCALSTLPMRYPLADVVIYFKFSRAVCLYRMIKRYLLQEVIPGDTQDKVLYWELIKYTWNFSRDKEAVIEELRAVNPHVEFRLVTCQKEANALLIALLGAASNKS